MTERQAYCAVVQMRPAIERVLAHQIEVHAEQISDAMQFLPGTESRAELLARAVSGVAGNVLVAVKDALENP